MRRIGRILLLCWLAAPAWALEAWALDLGEFVRSSYLGEPLRAQIALTGVPPDELAGLTVELADEETYRARGMVRPWLGTPLRMELVHDLGRPVVSVETDAPPQLAHADLILAVRWRGGQILKHYGLTLGEGWKAAEILPLPPLATMRPSAWPVAMSKPEPLVKRPQQAPIPPAAVAPQLAQQPVQQPVQQPAPPPVVVNPVPTPAPTPVAEALPAAPVAVHTAREAVVPEATPEPVPEPQLQAGARVETVAVSVPETAPQAAQQVAKQVPKPQSAGRGRVTAAKVEAKAPAGKPRLMLSQPAATKAVAAPAAAPATAKAAVAAPPAAEVAALEEQSVALARQVEEANARIKSLDAAAVDMKQLLALQAQQLQAKSAEGQKAEVQKAEITVPKLRSLERLLGQGQGLLAAIIAAVVMVTAWLLYRSGRRVRRLAARLGPAGPAAPAAPAAASRPALNLKAANDARAAYGTGATRAAAPATPLDLGGLSLDLKSDPAVADRPQRLPSGLMV